MKFNTLNIDDSIQNALQKKGFENTSEIQEKVIPEILKGKDIVGKSKTGTGKTAAFAIPLIQKIKEKNDYALIVVPTRELALQVKEEIASIARNTNVFVIAVFGGQNIKRQIDLLKRKPQIIVGTPGRLLDLNSRKVLYLNKTKYLVLDEADKMFDMGFRDDVSRIISFLPKEKHTMLFSATMPREILELIEIHLKKDKIVFDLSTDNAPVQEIQQYYIMVNSKEKLNALYRLLATDNSKTLVFCRTKKSVDWLQRQLSKKGIKTLAIHGDKKQGARNKIIEEFKRSKDGILIATDVVARGIHVDDIGNVVNFDFPKETEAYLHRIGRTARQGKTGKAISFCANLMEYDILKEISERNNTPIHQLE